MLARILLSALAAFALAAGASAQVSCPLMTQTETCTSTEMSSNNGGTATLNLAFTYCAPTQGFGSGIILSGASGQLNVNTGSAISFYTVSSLTGSITTGAPGSVQVPATVTLGSTQAPILSFSTAASGGTAAVITVTGAGGTGTTPITSNTPAGATSPSVILAGITLPLSTTILPANLQNLNSVTQDSCTAVRGDPLFSGFKGQQFYVAGEDGQVMNFISTFNMQLNGRFVTLQEGEAMFPHQQEKLQLESQVRHQAEPSVAAFPRTTAWTHPGNYIAEAGVALLEDNRVHVKAGSFATGFAKVALNGRNMPVSDEFVVFGQGTNTTYVQRVSAHELMVRTVNLEFTITNSDNFLNIEQVHMERGARQFNHFSGLLGKTADSKWSFSTEEETAAVVKSNDLFEHTAVQA